MELKSNQYTKKIFPELSENTRNLLRPLLVGKHEKDFIRIAKIVSACKKAGVKVCPEQKNMFRAFYLTPFEKIKVVILGQEPYANHKLATGLAFATPEDQKLTTSLSEVFEEVAIRGSTSIAYDITIGTRKEEQTLEHWAEQGVLLLNSALSVQENQPGSHIKHWNYFIQGVINGLPKDVIICAWGKVAQSFDFKDLKVLKSPLPEKFSKCEHFNLINQYLVSIGEYPIEWSLLPF